MKRVTPCLSFLRAAQLVDPCRFVAAHAFRRAMLEADTAMTMNFADHQQQGFGLALGGEPLRRLIIPVLRANSFYYSYLMGIFLDFCNTFPGESLLIAAQLKRIHTLT